MTLTLSIFYILPGTGFILNLIFLPLSTTKIGYILYFIMTYLIIFGFIFIVIFIIKLLAIDPNYTSKTQLIIVLSYAALVLLLLVFPGGITINEETNWRPKWSLPFLIITNLFFTFSIFIPTIIFSLKLNKRFEDKKLKRKLKYFFTGIIGMFISIYGLILYNTWDNPIYKIIWTFLSLTVVPSGLLIYYGIGHKL